MKHFALSLLAILFCFSGFAQDEQEDMSEAIQLIEVWLEAQKDYEKLPGLTAIAVHDQEVVWKGAFGTASRQHNMDASVDTRFSICSISKLFTSVAIMKLYDEGKLRLDDELKDILPWFKDLAQKYEVSGPITIRSLMTHSSGLPREAAYPYWTGPEFYFPTKEEIIDRLGEQETLYPASTYFQYSNLGLTLLGQVVEQISGENYDSYVRKHILAPLEMKATTTEIPKELLGKELADGYGALNRDGERDHVPIFQANGISPAAGFASTVEDLGKFASWQFELLDTNETIILKPSTLKFMQRVHWTDPDWNLSWGLGFSVRKSGSQTYVGHGGSCPGYRSTLTLNPSKKNAFAVMINAGATNPGKYASAIDQIFGKYKGAKEAEEETDFSDFTGLYDGQPWGSEYYMGSWKGQLVGIPLPTDRPAQAMTFFKHMEGDVFRRVRDNGELGEELVFVRDENGKVIKGGSHGNFRMKMGE